MALTVLICSHFKGIDLILEKLMVGSGIIFKETTGPELDQLTQEDKNPNNEKNAILIADNPHIVPIIYRKNLPFKFIQSTWAGVDQLLKVLDENHDPEIQLCRFAHQNFSQLMSEYIIGQTLMSERRFRLLLDMQSKSEWAKKGSEAWDYRNLRDLKIGILGCGQMGGSTAKLFKAFGCEIWGLVRNVPKTGESYIDHYCTNQPEGPGKTLVDLLQNCDYICSSLPRTPNTNNLLGNGLLKNCKGSVFINVGRSNVVKEEDLLEALEQGWLREAILDVFDTEPLPIGHPFWTHPKIVVTPHVSGLSMPRDIALCFKDNYERLLDGRPLAATVDWKAKY